MMSKKCNKKCRESVLRKTYPFLEIVGELDKRSIDKIFKQLGGNKEILNTFKEFSINLNKDNIPLDEKLRKKLKKHRKYFAKLHKCDINRCHPRSRAILNQKGAGILPLMLSALAPIISSIISSAVSKKSDD
jgi:hypothetical protein